MGRALQLTEVSVRSAGIVGDETTLSGWVEGDPAAVLRAAERARAQARDPLAESFTPVVVVPCGLHRLPVETGYYRVVDVDMRFDAAVNADGDAEIGLTLQRVQGYAAPLFESVLIGSKRAGVSASVTPSPWHAVSAASSGYELGTVTPALTVVPSESGDINIFSTADDTALLNARPQWHTPPADWYAGAASLLVGGHLVVGSQVPNRPVGWQVTNGIVRLTATPGEWNSALLERWGPSGWVYLGPVQFGVYGVPGLGLLPQPDALTVLRNSPECVTIRLTYDATSTVVTGRFAVTVDLSLRRGSPVFEVALASRGAYRWRVVTPVGSTGAVTAALAQADSDGRVCAIGNTDYLAPSFPRSYALPAPGQWLVCGVGWVGPVVNTASVTLASRRYAAAQSERILAVAR